MWNVHEIITYLNVYWSDYSRRHCDGNKLPPLIIQFDMSLCMSLIFQGICHLWVALAWLDTPGRRNAWASFFIIIVTLISVHWCTINWNRHGQTWAEFWISAAELSSLHPYALAETICNDGQKNITDSNAVWLQYSCLLLTL